MIGHEVPRRDFANHHLRRLWLCDAVAVFGMGRCVMQWHPIATAPKDRAVIVWGRYWSKEQGWMLEPKIARWDAGAFGGSWVVDHRYPFSVRPTHWMLPPEPPRPHSPKGE